MDSYWSKIYQFAGNLMLISLVFSITLFMIKLLLMKETLITALKPYCLVKL